MEITYKRRPSGQLGSKPNFTVELTAILGVILPKNSSSSVFWKKYRNKYRFVRDNLGKKQNSTPYLAEMWSRFPDHRGSRKIGSIILGKISLSKNKLWLNNLVLDFVNNQFFFYSTSVSWIFSEDLFLNWPILNQLDSFESACENITLQSLRFKRYDLTI